MGKDKKGNKQKFIEENFVTCKYCGYNNYKNRFQAFGKCLCCGKVIDDKVYFKAKLCKMAGIKNKHNRENCTFKNL